MLNLDVGTEYTFTEQELWLALGSPGTWSAVDWSVSRTTGTTTPPGMTVTATGLSGTPTTAGNYTIRMYLTDDYGSNTSYNLPVTVTAPEAEVPEGSEVPETVQAVADFLGQGDDEAVVALAGEALPVITAMARAYTRGGGFTEDGPAEDVAAVITTATARLMANPDQVQYRAGEVSFQSGFTSWTLAELFVLNRYRKRAIG